MDMPALEKDVEKALKLLPPQLVIGLLTVVMNYFHLLPGLLPQLVPLLQPHVTAGVLEHQTGLLTTDELTKCLMPVIQRYMIAHQASVGNANP